MPKIYEYFGIAFFFYANEHLPIHVHAKYGEYETKFEFVYYDGELVEIKKCKIRGKDHLPKNKMSDTIKFLEKYHKKIMDKWQDFFVYRKIIKSEKITKKIK